MGITKVEVKNSPDSTPCLQAHGSEISEDRWLSDLFLEIAVDRDHTASLVSMFPKRISRLCLTVLSLLYSHTTSNSLITQNTGNY